MSQALDKAQNPCLNLSPMSSPYADVKAYLQGNTLASRKKVLPIIKDFLREWERRTVHCGDVEDLELEDQFDPSRSPSMDDETRTRRYSASRQRRAAAEDIGAEEDCQVPPTPMNSLVEGCPLDNGLPKISPEAILEKFSKMANPEATEGKGVSGGHWGGGRPSCVCFLPPPPPLPQTQESQHLPLCSNQCSFYNLSGQTDSWTKLRYFKSAIVFGLWCMVLRAFRQFHLFFEEPWLLTQALHLLNPQCSLRDCIILLRIHFLIPWCSGQ